MKLAIVTFLAVFATLSAGPPVAQAATLLLDYVGFDYESPDPDTTIFGEVGSGYVGLGEVVEFFPPLAAGVDTTNNEYTYLIDTMTSVSRSVVGPFIIVDYTSPGIMNIYEDPKSTGTAATNCDSSSFVDGTIILVGELTNFRITFNTSNGTGSYEADFEATGGTLLGLIPVNQRTGWTFAGLTENAQDIPSCYQHQVDGQIFLDEPVPVQPSSWGKIKATYH